MKERNGRKAAAAVALAASLILLGYFAVQFVAKSRQPSGEIFLYGEFHSDEGILEREFELWSSYYHDKGMRDLFIEFPYYSAEYLNLWMKSDNDDILNQLYEDSAGTAGNSQQSMDFYRKIKTECPETVFHGTDVGHQYDTTGARFLEYLASIGQQQSEMYRLAQENIEQGRRFYEENDFVYRENTMVENFIREFDSLRGADVMGIYGGGHTHKEAMEYTTGSVPCMANQLYKKYGELLYTEDLTLIKESYRTDSIKVGEKEYTALYFGKMDLSATFPDRYQYREFWRLENAYDDFKDNPKTENVLPYDNYPMNIETGQVFVIDYTKTDGSVEREYFRSDGNTWKGLSITEEFSIE